MFCNPSLLNNIWTILDKLQIFCNAGTFFTNQVGDLEYYDTVWFYSEVIANILSLHGVTKKITSHMTVESMIN